MKSELEVHKIAFVVLSVLTKIFIVLLFYPFFVVFLCPVYVLRGFTVLASKIFRPDLIKTLGVRDTFYGVDKITSNPKSSVVVTLLLKGDFVRDVPIRAMKRVTSKMSSKTCLKYPELKRYIVKWMGFLFWKEDLDFSVENHVTYLEPSKTLLNLHGGQVTPQVLKQIEKQSVYEPFTVDRSPWEILIIRNYQPGQVEIQDENAALPMNGNGSTSEQYSVMLFKIHHSFIDGFSLVNMFLKEMVQVPDTAYLCKATFLPRSFFHSLLLSVFLFFKAPYDILSEAMMEPDKNPWYLTRERITNDINSSLSPRISSQKIKETARCFGVSFTSVVTSSIAGGIRRMMIQQGFEVDGNATSLSCLCPFPVPGHPETLGNYVSDCYMEFPIQIADRVERITHTEKQLQSLKYSTVPLSSFAVQPFLGGLFHWMVEPLVEFAMSKSTGIIASFPGPSQQIQWEGFPLLDFYYSAGHDSPGTGIQFLGLNYDGCWKLKIQADKGTLSTDAEVDQLMKYVVEELDFYHNSMSV